MALQVAERAVVGEHVEAVTRALERAARLVAPVGAVADVGAEERRAVVGRDIRRASASSSASGSADDGVERGSHHLDLALRIEV